MFFFYFYLLTFEFFCFYFASLCAILLTVTVYNFVNLMDFNTRYTNTGLALVQRVETQ